VAERLWEFKSPYPHHHDAAREVAPHARHGSLTAITACATAGITPARPRLRSRRVVHGDEQIERAVRGGVALSIAQRLVGEPRQGTAPRGNTLVRRPIDEVYESPVAPSGRTGPVGMGSTPPPTGASRISWPASADSTDRSDGGGGRAPGPMPARVRGGRRSREGRAVTARPWPPTTPKMTLAPGVITRRQNTRAGQG
jgi:hypothetical protein